MLQKEKVASRYLAERSWPPKCVLLGLPQPRCSLNSGHCGFKAIVPDPHHTHIFVLSLHSKCQAVTSTIVSRTCWSRREEKGREGEGDKPEKAQILLCSRRMSHFLAVTLRCLIYGRSADMKPISVPRRRPRARPLSWLPINHAALLWSAHRVGVLPASGL